SWSATSIVNAPSGREAHTAVWTGTEMIIWGGRYDGTGGRYNPATDTWASISSVNAPQARQQHTAVWSGSEMIIWGGFNGTFLINTGGRYDPLSDTWTLT